MNPVIILGAGGHTRTVIHTLKSLDLKISGILDQVRQPGEKVLGIPLLGEISTYLRYLDDHIFIVSIGDNTLRAEIFEVLLKKGGCFATVIHPQSTLAPSAKVGKGSLIAQGAMICPNANLGRNVIINSRALVEHDAVIEDHAHIGPDVSLAGGVRVKEGGFVGLRSVVRDGITIGRWARVGAGSVVVSEVPDGATVAGNPARIISMNGQLDEPKNPRPIVLAQTTLHECLERIDFYGGGYLVIVDEKESVLGILTDGNIRRLILKKIPLDTLAGKVMRTNFTFLFESKVHQAAQLFSSLIKFIPILDENKKLLKILHPSDVLNHTVHHSNSESLQLKELYHWLKNREGETYRWEKFSLRLKRGFTRPFSFVYRDAQSLLKRILHGQYADWSQGASEFWPSTYTNIPRDLEESYGENLISIILAEEYFNTPKSTSLIVTGKIEDVKKSSTLTLLRCGPKDDINLEGGGILFGTPPIEFEEDSALHAMQMASAQASLKKLKWS